MRSNRLLKFWLRRSALPSITRKRRFYLILDFMSLWLDRICITLWKRETTRREQLRIGSPINSLIHELHSEFIRCAKWSTRRLFGSMVIRTCLYHTISVRARKLRLISDFTSIRLFLHQTWFRPSSRETSSCKVFYTQTWLVSTSMNMLFHWIF